MFKKIKNWNKLIRFITQKRKKGESTFHILTTSNELIIYSEKHRKSKEEDPEVIRIKY